MFTNAHERQAEARVHSSISTLTSLSQQGNKRNCPGCRKAAIHEQVLGLMGSVTQCHSCAVYWSLDQPLPKPPVQSRTAVLPHAGSWCRD